MRFRNFFQKSFFVNTSIIEFIKVRAYNALKVGNREITNGHQFQVSS